MQQPSSLIRRTTNKNGDRQLQATPIKPRNNRGRMFCFSGCKLPDHGNVQRTFSKLRSKSDLKHKNGKRLWRALTGIGLFPLPPCPVRVFVNEPVLELRWYSRHRSSFLRLLRPLKHTLQWTLQSWFQKSCGRVSELAYSEQVHKRRSRSRLLCTHRQMLCPPWSIYLVANVSTPSRRPPSREKREDGNACFGNTISHVWRRLTDRLSYGETNFQPHGQATASKKSDRAQVGIKSATALSWQSKGIG